MSFSFGFSGDDIEEDVHDATQSTQPPTAASTTSAPPPIPARTHDLDELLSSLPDKISFSVSSTTSPKGFTAHLPRRELFDVRLQLMAEDDGTSSTPLSGLDSSDVRTNIYEGGFKTWECALDLTRYLLDHGPRKDLDDLVRVSHVLELGCGTALPSLLLFSYALRNGLQMNFSLTDYNADVLRLVTLPNMLLAWAGTLTEEDEAQIFTPTKGEAAEGGNTVRACISAAAAAQGDNTEATHADLYLTPAVLAAFKSTLARTGISLTFISGSWLPVSTLLDLIPSAPGMNTLLLASETIYSPASLAAFVEAMTGLLGRVHAGKALVAAKRVYFGVGGSVDEFRGECARRGCVAGEVEMEGLGDEGVRRCICEVQMY